MALLYPYNREAVADMTYLWWGLLLIVQQASQTFISRARNGDNLRTHALASAVSNSVWLVGQFIILDQWAKVKGDTLATVLTAVYYVVFCVLGSVSVHALALRKGNHERKIRTGAEVDA